VLLLGCVLATYGALNLVFGYPTKEARRRRQRLSEALRDLEHQGGRAALVAGGRIVALRSVTARHPWVYFVASPAALVAGIVLIVRSG
jgi:hypothetical protein